MIEEVTTLKMGGETLNSSVFKGVSRLHQEGIPMVFVHGGGNRINQKLEELGITPVKIDGKRVTDAMTLQIVVRTLDEIGRELSYQFEALGVKTFRAGAYSGILEAEIDKPELGFVGRVERVNIHALLGSLNAGVVPIITPIGSDKGNPSQKYNINGDDAAAAVSKAFREAGINSKLILMTDVPGVLDKDGEVISRLSAPRYHQMLKDDLIQGGMLAKLDAAYYAVGNGVRVVVCGPLNLRSVFQDPFLATEVVL